MIKSIALQNRAGAKTHPCLTPEVVENGEEQRPANRTLAVVVVCKSIIRPRMTFGTLMPFMAFQRAALSTESNADFRSTNAESSNCWNSLCISASNRSARIASRVERQRVKPDWWGRRCFCNSGSSLARRIWANNLPWTERRVIGRWLPHSFRGPFPLYKDTIMSSFHSAGIFPDLQTAQNRLCKALLTGSRAHFNSSGGMLSQPAARPFFSFRIARWTSSRVGASSAISVSGVVSLARSSSSQQSDPAGWFRACS